MSTEASKPGNVVEMRAAEAAPPATAETKAPARPSRRRRYIIMAALPIILAAVGGYFWLTGGRYVSTDNAYVQQDKVTLTAGVSGRIVEVAVHENQQVASNDLLFRIDPEPYRIAVDAADAALASARLQVEQLRASYEQAVAAATAARDDVGFKQKAFDRVKGLLAKGVSSQAAFDSAENDLHAAEQAASQADQRIQAALAALGGDANIATDKHPAVLAAASRLEQAKLDLANTEVRAPVAGVVSQSDRLQVGQYVANPTANPTALLAIVETGNTWVEANFKETDLTRMQPGKSATVSFDVFPGREFTGEVESIGAGTGAEFALLPAQNASGNWVKVVQRVPVRIRLSGDLSKTPLRAGLSAYVAVDITSEDGGLIGAAAAQKN